MGQNTLSVDSDKMPDERSMAGSTENMPVSRPVSGPEITTEKPSDASEDDTQYLSTRKLILVMLALYLSMFLVALVSQPTLHVQNSIANTGPGQNHHRNSNPANN